MIKLFVTDLDGCISHPFKTPDWESINKIRELNLKSRISVNVPPITICTGRPFPYAEAVAQWLDIQIPFIFESAGLFMWDGHRIETALKSTDGELKPIHDLKHWLKQVLLPEYPGAELEFTKMMDAGVVSPDMQSIREIHKRILEKVAMDYPDLEVHATDISVNILMPGNDKLQGLKLLSQNLGIRLDEMAYIGDSSGDVPALKNVKFPFAPINAHESAKSHGEVISLEATQAVLEAYRRVIEFNRSLE
jgi:hydroxymethylpyrimidine pyrophosphatase-like HAD family hydrolase